MNADNITLVPMTREMYHCYFKEYENSPDLFFENQEYVPYVYSKERADAYIQRQTEKKRVSLAVMLRGDIVGEIIIKSIEPKKCATLGITLKNATYMNKGIGTQAEKLAVQYVFNELDIPTLYADTIKSNTRSQHVLEKVGFTLISEDERFKYYKIERDT